MSMNGSRCKGCGQPIQWGFCDGRWVPLEPMETHGELDRRYVDEDGEFRADHRDGCNAGGEGSVNVTRLAKRIRPEEMNATVEDER